MLWQLPTISTWVLALTNVYLSTALFSEEGETAYAWGSNTWGELSDGTRAPRDAPAALFPDYPTTTTTAALAFGALHSAAIISMPCSPCHIGLPPPPFV